MNNGPESLVERAWSVLGAPTGGELASFPLDVAFGGIACRVARDNNRIRHFLVPCVDESPPVDVRPTILSAIVRPLVFSGRNTNYLDVSCRDAALHPEFNEVIDDILEAIENSSQPATEASRVIARWRRLFRSHLVRGLSQEAKLGLFAELSVLSALLDADPHFPIECWRGPLREPHDYEMQARCIEVKAISEGVDTFVVHGWEQLAPHGGRLLDLALVTVVADSEGTTLAELVEAVQQRTDAPTTLNARLLAAGWEHQAHGDDQDGFSLGPVFCVHVDSAVPRLIAADLIPGEPPVGLSALRYEVEIASVIPLAFGSSLASVAAGEAP